MGYLFLSLSLLAGAVKGFCGKKLGNLSQGLRGALGFNLIRMLLCCAFGLVPILLEKSLAALSPDPDLLWISALSGISTSFFVVTWLLAVKNGAYMMLDVFLLLGSLVPMLFGAALFSEVISLKAWLGFALLTVAVLFMCSYNNTIKTRLTPASVGLLVACGSACGVTGLSQKLFVKTLPLTPVSAFNLYTYLFAALFLLLLFLLIPKEKEGEASPFSRKSLWYLLVMALALLLNSQFKTEAAAHLDSAQLFPLDRGVSLFLSTLMAQLFFGEKITQKAFWGILLAFFSLLLINL